MIKVLVLTGAQAGATFDIPPTGASIGRSKMADIKLDDTSLSRLHCSFSVVSGTVYVQDLNSSNGTQLNGAELDDQPHAVRSGDVLTIGDVALRISMEELAPPAPPPPAPPPAPPTEAPMLFPEAAPAATPETVDLGLEEKKDAADKKRSPIRGLIYAIAAILILLLGAVGVLHVMETPEPAPVIKKLADDTHKPFEFAYERLKIDEDSLFRYTLTATSTGLLSLSITDLGGSDRSFSEEQQLSTQAQNDLRQLIVNSKYASIPKMYALQSSDGSLERKTLTITYGAEVWTRTSENDPEAVSFDALCNQLEAFAKLKLGVIATQYSTEELIALAQEKLQVAQLAWEERDLAEDKLYAAVTAYKEGLQLLRTLNPKPDFAKTLVQGLEATEALLAQRYDQAHFGVQKALQTKQYAEAQANLQSILRMIPDREDQRNIDATAELLNVESMMKNRRP